MFQKITRHLSIRSIVLLSFIPLVLLIFFTYYGFYRVGSSQLKSQTYENAVNVNTQISRSLAQTLDNVYQTASSVVSNPYFFSMMKKVETDRTPVIEPTNYYHLSELLDNLIDSNPDYFHSISLYLDDRSIFVYRTTIGRTVTGIDFDYENYADVVSNKTLTWILPQNMHPYRLSSGNYSSLGLMLLIGTPESKTHGFLIFEITDSLLEKEIKNAIITPGSLFYIMSGSIPLICSGDESSDAPELSSDIQWTPAGGTSQSHNHSDSFFYTPVTSTAQEVQLAILSQIPHEEIELNQKPLFHSFLLILALCSVICALSYSLIHLTVSRPFHRLTRTLSRPVSLSEQPAFDVSGCAEITMINHTLNRYTALNRKLIDDLYREMDERRIAELNILYEQINPHFLYNALDTIYQLCELDELQKAMKMTEALATFYRIGVSKGANYVRLEEEFSHALGFLDVMEIRFDDFTYQTDLPDALRKCYTIKQILQPILENAIYHGIHALHDRMGTIFMQALEVENGILLKISDNGVGMESETLEEIRRDLDTRFAPSTKTEPDYPARKLYGLKNVHKRIQLTFGAPYGVTLESQPDRGTTVSLLIPKLITAPKGGSTAEDESTVCR